MLPKSARDLLGIALSLCLGAGGCSSPTERTQVEGTGGSAVGGRGGRGGNAGSGGGGGRVGSGGNESGGNTSKGGSGGASSAANGGGSLGTGGNTSPSGAGGTGSGGLTGDGSVGDSGRGGQAGHDAGDAGGSSVVDAASLPLFSFFVTSLVAMRALSGSQNGFGGDLRYGETGVGAGLRGADKICAAVAERSMPGASAKQWRAFLSTSTTSAIDRVGTGPWYDRKGRPVAKTTADLISTRPRNASPLIANDLPNEDGVPNHAPDGTAVDDHDTLTGSGNQGKLFAANATCSDWTSLSGSPPRVGHSWPGGPSQNWINAHNAGGCAAGVNLASNPPQGSGNSVGSGGGYGGIYCFALVP